MLCLLLAAHTGGGIECNWEKDDRTRSDTVPPCYSCYQRTLCQLLGNGLLSWERGQVFQKLNTCSPHKFMPVLIWYKTSDCLIVDEISVPNEGWLKHLLCIQKMYFSETILIFCKFYNASNSTCATKSDALMQQICVYELKRRYLIACYNIVNVPVCECVCADISGLKSLGYQISKEKDCV